MDTNESDESLVARYRTHRDELAFRTLVERYQCAVRQLAISVLGIRFLSDGDDVVQDVFVRVHQGLNSFRADSQFRTWLYRIAYNQSLTHKARCIRQYLQIDEQLSATLVGASADPASIVSTQQLRRTLDAAIDRLPAEYQMAVRLHYWFHLSMNEIASRMSVRENTVKSYLHRARKLLANHLQQQREDL